MENKKHEIIDVQDGNGQSKGTWAKIKQKVTGMSKKTIVLLSVGALILVSGGFILAEVLEDRFDNMEDRIERRYDRDDEDDDVTSHQENTTSQSVQPVQSAQELATSYGVTLVEKSDIDGTYTATEGNDSYTLTVTGNQATLVERDQDNDQDSDIIIFDLDKKLAYIDGEAESYTFDGKTLTFTEIDNNDVTKDSLIFTKQ